MFEEIITLVYAPVNNRDPRNKDNLYYNIPENNFSLALTTVRTASSALARN